jgi:hypothetical protein
VSSNHAAGLTSGSAAAIATPTAIATVATPAAIATMAMAAAMIMAARLKGAGDDDHAVGPHPSVRPHGQNGPGWLQVARPPQHTYDQA